MAIAWNDILKTLIDHRELTGDEMRGAMGELMAGTVGDAQAAGFLMGLRVKGETAHEVAVAAEVMREHMVRWDSGRANVLDTCGTGGDSSGTFNISTATAFVVAGAGVPVVKHGNRAVSSRSGSADVLAALGVALEGDPVHARRCLDEANLAFCFAPRYHPALRHLGNVRKALGVPTLFNCLGPLANPAGASYQLMGVGSLRLLDLMAGALAQLDTRRALVVHSRDGMDEVSLAAPTMVREVHGTAIRSWEWNPDDFGLGHVSITELAVHNAEESAALIEKILEGEDNAAARIVMANAAAALVVMERAADVREGVAMALGALRSGAARRVLDVLRKLNS